MEPTIPAIRYNRKQMTTPPPSDQQRRNNRIALGVILALPICCGLGIFGACSSMNSTPDPATLVNRNMREAEVQAAEMQLRGTLLYETDMDSVRAIDLATGEEKDAYQCKGDYKVWAVDGPNRNGIAVLIENNMTAKRHRLVRLDLVKGTSSVVFERAGDALWEDEIDEQTAIAENRNLAVVHMGTGNLQLYDPQAYMGVGKTVLVDLASKRETVIDSASFSGCAAISPDGDRVWLSKPVERARAKALPGGSAVSVGRGPVPAIFVWIGGASLPIASGDSLKVHPQVDRIELYDTDANRLLWNPKTGSVSSMPTPDYVYAIEEWFKSGLMICTAPQSDPSKVEIVGDNFSRGKQAKERIVAIHPEKGQVHTIVPQFDSTYDKWSFGEWSAVPHL